MYEDILTLTQHLFEILQLIAPGYLTIWWYKKLCLRNKEAYDTGATLILSALLSALYDGLFYVLCSEFVVRSHDLYILLLLCIIGLIVGTLAWLVVRSKVFLNTYSAATKTLPYEHVLDGNLIFEREIEIYGKDGTYYGGRLVEFGDIENDPWIAIDCAVIIKDQQRVYDAWRTPHPYRRVFIAITDVQYITMAYKPGDVKYPNNWDELAAQMLKEQAELDEQEQQQRLQDLNDCIYRN